MTGGSESGNEDVEVEHDSKVKDEKQENNITENEDLPKLEDLDEDSRGQAQDEEPSNDKQESKGENSDEEEQESVSSSSESESDSMDEEETENRRLKYKEDIFDLEKQFSDLKEQLYKEKVNQVENQLIEVQTNTASEYVIPLKELEDSSRIRSEVAGHLKEYRLISLDHKFKAEVQALDQHFQNEKRNLLENMKAELEERLRKVEEDRHTVEMYSDIWLDDSIYARKRKKGMEMFIPEKRKRPVTVSGPYIVYMLREMDILEDWAAIRKAKSELARRKTEEEKHPLIQAKYEDGKFYYEGQWFHKGDKVILDNRVDSPVKATIATINTGEVWVRKRDGIKCKLYIAQFQKGKYLMQRQTSESTQE
ncbi:breast cancer metastasis-suppressor 1-like protein-A [Rhopilema esculentum]|uniref:breast cancer metastasis-suppressor 1-like protein-A n=1 Tax=Rhopilema esculentum TaxID=499914 RepID=UPI0031DE050A